jgi:hypothetical protein
MLEIHFKYNNEKKIQYRQFKSIWDYRAWLTVMPEDHYIVVTQWEVV